MASEKKAPAARVVHIDAFRARRIEHNQAKAQHPEGTLAGAWELFEGAGYGQRHPKSTVNNYRAAMARAIKALPPSPQVGEVEQWLHRMVAEGRSPATANWALRAARAVVARAYKHSMGYAKLHHALHAAEPLPTQPKAPRCPPHDIIQRLYPVCIDMGDRAWLHLVSSTGMRKGEMLGLQPQDYNHRTRLLVVTRQRKNTRRKNRRPVTYTLSEQCGWLVQWAITHPEEMRRDGRRGPRVPSVWVFPWSEKYLADLLERFRAELGADADAYLPRGTAWHAFRHLFGTIKAKQTGRADATAAALGDASDAMAAVYNEALRSPSAVGTDAVEGELFGAATEARELDQHEWQVIQEMRAGAKARARARARSEKREKVKRAVADGGEDGCSGLGNSEQPSSPVVSTKPNPTKR